ncbi:membrane protein involved in the export of O-antigen and teichoic acid [Beggiatoa alba B18LD]|uniref:Membrane protein involved in the export of O-antigen and teichoic acid n=1 Tax=Beggiatoa alba B18LD TaxID=395493 RepID=I3CIB8_9GAMM|nr:hypothetical protein [Beggiatoa alba]EIJ43361.1 membrane protein involved in the export of O-antigen and teichoic acid [Beggiatoa alba B18LD]
MPAHLNWTLIDQAMVSLVNFLTGVLVARLLGIESFGFFALLWTILFFFSGLQIAFVLSPLLSLGTQQATEQADSYYSVVLVQQLLFAILSSLCIFAGLWFSNWLFPAWHTAPYALLLALTSFTYQLQDFIRRYFFTLGNTHSAFTNDVISYLGQLAGLLGLYYWQIISIHAVLWVTMLSSLLAIVIGLKRFRWQAWETHFFYQVTQRHWLYARWLCVSVLLERSHDAMMKAVITAVLGVQAVGVFRACQNVLGVTHVLLLALENFAPPRAGRVYIHTGKASLQQYLVKLTRYGGAVMAVIVLLLGGFPDSWLYWFYGDEFEGYGAILSSYALVYFLVFFLSPLKIGLRVLENTRPLFYALLWATVVSLAILYPLTVWLGLQGTLLQLCLFNAIQVAYLFVALRLQLKS